MVLPAPVSPTLPQKKRGQDRDPATLCKAKAFEDVTQLFCDHRFASSRITNEDLQLSLVPGEKYIDALDLVFG